MAQAKLEADLRDSVHRYGKQIFSEAEQIRILNCMLEDAKSKLAHDSDIFKLITENQLKLAGNVNLQNAIIFMNGFVIALEALDHKGQTVRYLKEHGFYRILYRNPQIKGFELPPNDALNKLLKTGIIGIVVSALITLLFAATAFVAVPFWLTAITTGLFIGASAYLSGILYGVVNDLFATQSNFPYFLLGHQPDQLSLLRTNDKVVQGIAWGIAATFGPVIIATVLFTITATIAAFFVPIATFIMPIMMIAMPLIAVGAEIYARKKTRSYIDEMKDFTFLGSNYYQRRGLNYMSPTQQERAAYFGNNDRNTFGFTKVPIIGLGVLVALIVLSAVNKFLPPFLLASPIIAIAIPAALAALASIALLAAAVYMHVNRNKQIDNRYRLEFSRDEVEPNLYLDEDMTYVETLLKTYKLQEPGVNLESTEQIGTSIDLFAKNLPNKPEIVETNSQALEKEKSVTDESMANTV